VLDVAHVRPSQKGVRGRVPGRFDTVLVNAEDRVNDILGVRGLFSHACACGKLRGQLMMISGCSITQVRVVFKFPKGTSDLLDCHIPQEHHAYVEWFSKISGAPDRNHKMFKTMRLFRDGHRVASIIPISRIRRSVHLFPKFGQTAPRHWTSTAVLEQCDTFYINPLSDRHSYVTIH